MRHEVRLTAGAKADLRAIRDWMASVRDEEDADRLIETLGALAERLAEFPERGAFPPELLTLGIRRYRQLLHHPYRLIYRVEGQVVFVVLIADGRRDMRTLLSRRLLTG
ncbi:type II toxin-antitoxin system RelE/ParE family toxin [Sandaracinobacteroides saxicola]|uniref:Type II toxin-antitoxin system RelE/ParE family toxin n=1 Tax=Sandaracinobacteroides saxicola TaxID=2759707 RepID=A0A7G5IGJ7_9SPHN|nr:type II toxin-antitoxin system RelE/ParE family toxin [Sandaracinobacteroides saxicola]QMW22489.1 type II toxin-antitoxin system RelE/ParE family toxin [Sandaracinobacteroides saxicola]